MDITNRYVMMQLIELEKGKDDSYVIDIRYFHYKHQEQHHINLRKLLNIKKMLNCMSTRYFSVIIF